MTPDTNAVRAAPGPDKVLVPFPEHRILHARAAGDYVAVTHRGETTIYVDPADLAAAVRARDPKIQEQELLVAAALEASKAHEAEARELFNVAATANTEARARLIEAIDLEHRARVRLRRAGIVLAIAKALTVLLVLAVAS